MDNSAANRSSASTYVQNFERDAKLLYHAYNIFEASPSFLEKDFIYTFDGPFQEYPRFCGVDTTIWERGNGSSNISRELAAFAEQWLIHGLLRTYLGPACRSIPRSSCMLHDGSIQVFYATNEMTTWLIEEIGSWQYLLATKPKEIIRAKYEKAWNCYEISQKVFHHLFLSSGISIPDPAGRDLGLPFLFLFQLVGEHLGHALCQFPGHLSLMRHMSARARQPNWSKRDRIKFHTSLDEEFIETLGDIPLLVSKDWGRNRGVEELFPAWELDFLLETTKHSVSTLQQCALTWRPVIKSRRRQALDENRDQPQHVHEDCTCENIGPDIDTVKKIIRNGRLPLLRWTQDPISLEVIEHTPDIRYIAISHVWSDGRGNEAENSLPICQLKDMFASCLWDGEFPIWMDTLCIPVDDEFLRKEAIKNMNKTYYEAHRVVVISNDLRSRPYTDGIDDWLAFRSSAWMKRMWTLQEGVFGGPQLWVCFKDCVKNFVSEMEKYRFLDYLSPVAQFADSTLTIFGDIDQLIQERRLSELIGHILTEFKWRQTKKKVDAPVIFASLLGLNPEVLLNRDRAGEVKKHDRGKGKGRALNSTSTSTEEQEFLERMEILYSRISEFPAEILYRTVPRMQKPGRRWAPQSLHIPDWNPEIGFDKFAPIELVRLSPTKGEVLHRGLRVEVWVTAVEHPALKGGFPARILLKIPNTCPECAATKPYLRFHVLRKKSTSAADNTDSLGSGYTNETMLAGTCRFAILQRRIFGAHQGDPDWYADSAIIEIEQGFETFKGFFTPPYKGPGAWWGFKDFISGRTPGITGRYIGPASVYAIDDDIEDTLDSSHNHHNRSIDAAYEHDLSQAIAASLRDSVGGDNHDARGETLRTSSRTIQSHSGSAAAEPSSRMAAQSSQTEQTIKADIDTTSLTIRDILDNKAPPLESSGHSQRANSVSSSAEDDGDIMELVGIRPGQPFPVIVT